MARMLKRDARYHWRWTHEGGMALVLSISVRFVVFALGAVWIGIGTHQVTITGRDKPRATRPATPPRPASTPP